MFHLPPFLRLRKRSHTQSKAMEISWPIDVQHNSGNAPPQTFPRSFDGTGVYYRSESPSPRPVKRPYPTVEETLREEKEKMLRERGEIGVVNHRRRRRSRAGSIAVIPIPGRSCICGRC